MDRNRPLNNRLVGEVLATRMVMSVRLADGSIVDVNGSLPKGSEVAILATDIAGNKVLGLERVEVIRRAVRTLESAADAVPTVKRVPA